MKTEEQIKKCLPLNIKTLRMEMKWTQTKLAKEAGTTPAAICRIESGIRFPSLFTLLNISEALGVGVTYLFDGLLDSETLNLIKPSKKFNNEKYNIYVNERG